MKMYHSSGIERKYFVLNLRSKRVDDLYARASRKAMGVFAREIAENNPDLSSDLLLWIESEKQNERKLLLEEEALYSRWIEKKVFVDSACKGSNYSWDPVIRCGMDCADETVSFLRQIHPELEYRIAPE